MKLHFLRVFSQNLLQDSKNVTTFVHYKYSVELCPDLKGPVDAFIWGHDKTIIDN